MIFLTKCLEIYQKFFQKKTHVRLAGVLIVAGTGILTNPLLVPVMQCFLPLFSEGRICSQLDLASFVDITPLTWMISLSLIFPGILLFLHGDRTVKLPPAIRTLDMLFSTGLPKDLKESELNYIKEFLTKLAESGDINAKLLLVKKNVTFSDFIAVMLEHHTNDHYFNLAISKMYYCSANMGKAEEYCEKQINLSPKDYEAKLFMASIYEHQHQSKLAMQYVQDAIKVLTNSDFYEDYTYALMFHWHLDKEANISSLEIAREIALKHGLADKVIRIFVYLGEDISNFVGPGGSSEQIYWNDIKDAKESIKKKSFGMARLILDNRYKRCIQKEEWLRAEQINRLIIECYKEEKEYGLAIIRIETGLQLAERAGCTPALLSNYYAYAQAFMNPKDTNIKNFQPEKGIAVWKTIQRIAHDTDDSSASNLAAYEIETRERALAIAQNLEKRVRNISDSIATKGSTSEKKIEWAKLMEYAFNGASSVYIELKSNKSIALYNKIQRLKKLDYGSYKRRTAEIVTAAALNGKHSSIVTREHALSIMETILSDEFHLQMKETLAVIQRIPINFGIKETNNLALGLKESELATVTEWMETNHNDQEFLIGTLYASFLGRCSLLSVELAKSVIHLSSPNTILEL